VLITRSLLFAADGAGVFRSRVGEPILRAYDKGTGNVVGAIELPARARGCPMTYLHQGVQYIVIPVADADHDPELIALAVPGPGPGRDATQEPAE
jgi:quinoprotein glucose dehydrogenase